MSRAIGPEEMLIGVGVIVLGVLTWKAAGAANDAAKKAAKAIADTAAGIVSGDNALTQGATDSNGNPVDAYQGAGVVGTIGAATNIASGGWFATAGEWIGGKAYDLTH